MEDDKPNALIVGGSSGLGLELGLRLSSTHRVIVTGRRDPKNEKVDFRVLYLSAGNLFSRVLDVFVAGLPRIDLFVYAAGFYQDRPIDALSDEDVANMVNVGLTAPVLLLQRLLKKQHELPGFIAITSTSQWTPRPLEPVYTAVKSGLGMLANSLSFDGGIGKVLVAGPGGMKNTRFYADSPRDTSTMLDPEWVAEQILNQYSGNFRYQCVRLPRDPARVEILETR